MQTLRLAVMGTGAVGGYFGALLARAGHDVTFIARGAQLDALRGHGLAILGPHGDFSLERVSATDDPSTIAPVDVVLFCVKLYDTESAAYQIKPLLARGGVCISLQNGVDAQDRLAPILGRQQVMGGLAFVSGVIEAPGVIRTTSQMSGLRFGETDGSRSPRALAFEAACRAAGFDAEAVTDIRATQWQKFVGLCTNAALSCLVRKPAGVVYHDADLIPIARAAFDEVAAVARAQNITMPEDVAEQALRMHQSFPPKMYASMYHDLARGRRLELDSLSGVVVQRGRELGVPTPVHAMAYACLKPYMNGKDGEPQS